jgi:hypothetical protein
MWRQRPKIIQYTTNCICEKSVMNLSHYTSHNKLHHQATRYLELITIYIRGIQCTFLHLMAFNSELFTTYMRRNQHVFCIQPVLTIIYLNIIPIVGIIILVWPLYFTFVKESPHPEIIFCFMDTVLLPDNSQSNRPKHVTENVENLPHFYQLCFSEHKKWILRFIYRQTSHKHLQWGLYDVHN